MIHVIAISVAGRNVHAGPLVLSQHLNVLEFEVHHYLLDEGKLERVAPHDY